MTKYVDIDVAKEAVRKAECDANWDECRFDAEFIENALDFVPAANVAPVVHGKWIPDGDFVICSQCEAEMNQKNSLGMGNSKNYCPNCGAKMDLEG